MEHEVPEVEERAYSHFQVYLESNSCGAHSYLYKYRERTFCVSQQERREAFLREQKEKRHKVADKNREFELFCEQSDAEEEPMDYELAYTAYKAKKRPRIRLMRSEWFTEIPEDLEDNWLVKFAPDGVRAMVVAKRRRTTLYTARGFPYATIQSNFPGGGGSDRCSGPTILDCIFNKKTQTIFILDCLCWNNMSMIDTEARFRFLWLNSKFSELPDLLRCRHFRFRNMTEMPAEKSLIQDKMLHNFTVENDTFSYDGVVFYHKESHYTFGLTPLVGWLTSYMLPEMLHIDVSPEHLLKKPKNYQNIHHHIRRFLSKGNKPKEPSQDEEMDKS